MAQKIFYDSFTDSSSTAITSHTPDTGTGWTQIKTVGAGAFQISFNELAQNGGASEGGIITADGTYPADYVVEVKATQPDSLDDYNHVLARIQDSDNYYALEYNESVFALYKVSSGTWTNIGSDLGSLVVADDIIRLEVEGSQIRTYVNGVVKHNVTDATHSSAGEPGVGMGAIRDAAGDMSVQRLDDFTVYQHMFDASSSHAGGGTSASYSHTTGSGDNRKMLIGIMTFTSNSANRPVSSCTYNGVSATQILSEDTGAGTSERLEIWYLDDPATGANTVAVSTAGSCDGILITTLTLENATAGAVDASGSANGSSGGSSVTITPSANGTFVASFVASEPNISGVGTTQVLREEQEPVSYRTGGMSTSYVEDTSVTHTFSHAYGARWRIGAVAVEWYETPPVSSSTWKPQVMYI